MSADTEYTNYELAMARLDALMGEQIPRIPREEYDDMRELLEARISVFA
jgi:hypothetical protein